MHFPFYEGLNPFSKASGYRQFQRDGYGMNTAVFEDKTCFEMVEEAFWLCKYNFSEIFYYTLIIIAGTRLPFSTQTQQSKGVLDFLILPLITRKIFNALQISIIENNLNLTGTLFNLAIYIALPLELVRTIIAITLTIAILPLVLAIHCTKMLIIEQNDIIREHQESRIESILQEKIQVERARANSFRPINPNTRTSRTLDSQNPITQDDFDAVLAAFLQRSAVPRTLETNREENPILIELGLGKDSDIWQDAKDNEQRLTDMGIDTPSLYIPYKYSCIVEHNIMTKPYMRIPQNPTQERISHTALKDYLNNNYNTYPYNTDPKCPITNQRFAATDFQRDKNLEQEIELFITCIEKFATIAHGIYRPQKDIEFFIRRMEKYKFLQRKAWPHENLINQFTTFISLEVDILITLINAFKDPERSSKSETDISDFTTKILDHAILEQQEILSPEQINEFITSIELEMKISNAIKNKFSKNSDGTTKDKAEIDRFMRGIANEEIMRLQRVPNDTEIENFIHEFTQETDPSPGSAIPRRYF